MNQNLRDLFFLHKKVCHFGLFFVLENDEKRAKVVKKNVGAFFVYSLSTFFFFLQVLFSL